MPPPQQYTRNDIHGGGLFITPKLFDLNGLSKIMEDENAKKESNKRSSH